MRAGGKTLTLLGAPRTILVLRSLSEGTKGQLELRRDAGSPAQSTLRGHLRTLETTGVVLKHRRDTFPGALEYSLTDPGRELLTVARSVERWLAMAPQAPLELGSDPAKAAIKGLVEGWTATVLPALADGPLTLTQLDKRIAAVSYPTIERCLQTMRLARQLEVGERSNKGTPYAVTDWLRHGLAPLTHAARWEHRHQADGAAAVDHIDIADALILSAPLFRLPGRLSGICQLAVNEPGGSRDDRRLGYLEVRRRELTYGQVYPDISPDAWASGTVDSWFATVIDTNAGKLKLSGDRKLASDIFERLHNTLFDEGAKKDAALAEARP
jgi:DNA-binding HxlR family transcriptional regulator